MTLTPGGNTLYAPMGVFYDGQRLYIADESNNRVLVYNTLPTTNGASADEVIGEANFTSQKADGGLSGATSKGFVGPKGLWVDSGSLYVADTGNNRILIYNNGGNGIDTLAGNNPAADGVVGQGSYTTNLNGCSATQLNGPMGVCASNCQLYISDTANNRVLVYGQIPTGTVNPPASVVLGQPNMTSNTVSGALTGKVFVNPYNLQAVGGMLYMTDLNDNRLMVFVCGAGAAGSSGVKEVVIQDATPREGGDNGESEGGAGISRVGVGWKSGTPWGRRGR